MKYLLTLFVLWFVSLGQAQNYTTQEMTLQLDENGIATLTPEDVLVNTKGILEVLDWNNDLQTFHYDLETNSLNFIEEFDFSCIGAAFSYSYDRNPINNRKYVSGTIIDVADFLTRVDSGNLCIDEEAIFSSEGPYIPCDFNFEAPLLFSFDRNGILYEINNSSAGDFSTFDVHSNIRTLFAEDIFLEVHDSGLTYDFDNHRFIGTNRSNGDLNFIAINIETQDVETLVSIPIPGDCNSNAIEYIGNDVLIVGSSNNLCSDIYTVNLVTQDINVISNQGDFVINFLFIEDEIPDATLSTSQFTCSDLGEQIVDITVIENGIPVSYQSTVTIVSDFSVRNCEVYRQLTTPDPDGSNDALVEDYSNTIDIVSSCSSNFTIIQDPSPGTLVPYGEAITILLTVTDEFGNTTFCSTLACSDSILSTVDVEIASNDFLVHPVPTNDIVTLENRKNVPISSIELSDINGRVLETITTFDPEQNNITLSFVQYSVGLYFVTIISNDQRIVKQVIRK